MIEMRRAFFWRNQRIFHKEQSSELNFRESRRSPIEKNGKVIPSARITNGQRFKGKKALKNETMRYSECLNCVFGEKCQGTELGLV